MIFNKKILSTVAFVVMTTSVAPLSQARAVENTDTFESENIEDTNYKTIQEEISTPVMNVNNEQTDTLEIEKAVDETISKEAISQKETIINKLQEKGLIVDKYTANENNIKVMGHTENNTHKIVYNFNLNTDVITTEVIDNKIDKKQEYLSEIYDNSTNDMKVKMTDTGTKETQIVSSNEVHDNIPFAIPLVIYGAEVILALAASAVIVYKGIELVRLGKVAAQIINTKNRKYNHYKAKLKDGKVYIYRKSAGISYAAAVRRGKYNKEFKDVWSVSRSYAKKVAQGVNPKGSPINETNLSIKNKNEQYHHYHPYKRTPAMHSFYGSKPVY